jgi:hypothetical protein
MGKTLGPWKSVRQRQHYGASASRCRRQKGIIKPPVPKEAMRRCGKSTWTIRQDGAMLAPSPFLVGSPNVRPIAEEVDAKLRDVLEHLVG